MTSSQSPHQLYIYNRKAYNMHEGGYYSARTTPTDAVTIGTNLTARSRSVPDHLNHINFQSRSRSVPEKLNQITNQPDKHTDIDSAATLCEPITTTRLRPIRQQIKNAVMTILEDCTVCVEFFKVGQGKITQVLNISADGQKIQIFHPTNKAVLSDTVTRPSDKDHIKSYSYHNLPPKYWKKYNYAAKFVNLVRSKTPKVTMYTEKAKFILMENLIDFEAVFYDGAKVAYNQQSAQIQQANGKCLTFESKENLRHLAPLMLKYVEECEVYCRKLEKVFSENVDDKISSFPIIIGRRPVCDTDYSLQLPKPVCTSTPTENNVQPKTDSRQQQALTSSPCCQKTAKKLQEAGSTNVKVVIEKETPRITETQVLPSTDDIVDKYIMKINLPSSELDSTKLKETELSHETDIYTGVPTTQNQPQKMETPQNSNVKSSPENKPSSQPDSSKKPGSLNSSIGSNSSTPLVICKVFIEETGWASQWSNGEISIQYLDGCELSIQMKPSMVIRFTNIKGVTMGFTQADQLPVLVQNKLQNLAVVTEKLELAQTRNN